MNGKRTRRTARGDKITKVGQTENLGHKQMQIIVSVTVSSFPQKGSKRICDKQEAILRTYISNWTNDPNEMLVNAFGKRKDQSRNHLQLSKQCSWKGKGLGQVTSALQASHLTCGFSFLPQFLCLSANYDSDENTGVARQVHGWRPDFTSSFHSFSFG